jgi:hypothetical protein
MAWFSALGGRIADLKSEYGGEWLRPDGGSTSCMPRTPVGLANHPALKLNWQLSVAHGCLIRRPVLPDFACGSVKGVTQRAGHRRFLGPAGRELSEIADS